MGNSEAGEAGQSVWWHRQYADGDKMSTALTDPVLASPGASMTEKADENRARLVAEIRRALDDLPRTRTPHIPNGSLRSLIRASHVPQRRQLMVREAPFIRAQLPRLAHAFASGKEVVPHHIQPEIEAVTSGSDGGNLFRLVTALWSVPVSRGFGRRMRFLVRDQSNGKLIGIFALGDPVFNLRARDEWIGWSAAQRQARLVSVMDGYVVGAVPPYNVLLGGKLITSLIASREVADVFDTRYGHTAGRISGEHKHAELAAVTISSALGRSSMYNRVRLPGLMELARLGTTKGYGHFHVTEPLFAQMRELLRSDGHRYADGHSFGDGPSWRMRVIREAIRRVGLDDDFVRHGISREVFGMGLASNFAEYLKGQDDQCRGSRPRIADISAAAVERWVIPRSLRVQYQHWQLSDMEAQFHAALAVADTPPRLQLALPFTTRMV